MPVAFTLDVPANAEMYGKIRAGLDAKFPNTPDGLIAHIVHATDNGLRYTDVWASEAQWQAFQLVAEDVVGEVLAGYGLPHDESLVTFTPIDLVDTWL